MRVLVVGSGAVGSLLAWALADAGEDVTIVRRHAGAGAPGGPRRDSIVVRRPDGSRSVAVVRVVSSIAVVTADGGDAPDVVLVAVRQHDLPAVLRDLASLPDAVLVTVQNGIGAEDAAVEARPEAPLLAASLSAAVEVDADRTVGWLRRGGIGVAPVRAAPGEEPDAGVAATAGRRLVSAFEGSGLPARWIEDARAMKWSKLIANLVGNATSALLDLDPAAVYRDPRLFAIERDQLLEALRVMDALGLPVVDLPGAPVTWLARAVRLPGPLSGIALRRVVAGARGGKDPSLRIVLTAGGPTEASWLNGAVARAAAAQGLEAPVNAGLARLVDEAAADPARRTWFVHQPDRLVGAIRDPVP